MKMNIHTCIGGSIDVVSIESHGSVTPPHHQQLVNYQWALNQTQSIIIVFKTLCSEQLVSENKESSHHNMQFQPRKILKTCSCRKKQIRISFKYIDYHCKISFLSIAIRKKDSNRKTDKSIEKDMFSQYQTHNWKFRSKLTKYTPVYTFNFEMWKSVAGLNRT